MNRFLVLASAGAMMLPTLSLADETRLPGHRAVYELTLGETKGSASIEGAEGRYVFDLEDVCEGYTLNERLVVRLMRDGGAILTDYRLSAFETENGDLYRFSTETEFGGRSGQSATGALRVKAESAEVDYESAEDVSFDEAVLPPLAHIRAILDAARAGEERYAATVFDGDIDKPVFYAVTRISPVADGEEAQADMNAVEGGEALEDVARWRIDSVYFPPSDANEAENALPEFRFTATMYENGVVTGLLLDYLDFSLEATLVDLDVHEGGC